ncbi:aminodeoxychorismate lyase [Azospirillum thiophilum]|uniref:Endolytic murein transglycosylase n=1 Tax=Azospirillum thiophilum TaxID=528244 RepID=A0AAC8VY90_9PROT|nr:endolytic transglycosylase MltG [Azospirillum thiophilum]ALG71420.1 aminodeoxychorismate lyase [Azospirillum thiophilum]KJR64930.1 aminodeoxychorismate lyase [Azospirillum thiophilum]
MGWGLRIFTGTLALVVGAAGGIGIWGIQRYESPGPLEQAETVVIPRGSGLEAIAITLGDSGVIGSPLVFIAAAKLTGAFRELKAGEYQFPAGISIEAVLEQMRQGRTVVHRFTVPEGLSSAQVIALLEREAILTGHILKPPKEGSLLPETYHFAYGDSRTALVERMQTAMSQALAEAWKNRDPNLPFETPQQALTLASVVEKETGIAAERPKVAGVFVNRLETGMKLQSDPTVIYALTEGSGELGRALTRNDWKFESPYNTYQVNGLPPGPIANPGKASIQAVMKPERHEFLYFVADGTGGHVFAKSLPDHNRNVAKWREFQQSRQPDHGDTSSE